MELLQLAYFCSAAKYESFSKTAKVYSVPASNISQSIQRLERELGVKLFDRTANRVSLNEQGKCFYESVKEALALIDSAKKSLSEKEGIFGEIRILALTNRRIVTKAIESFEAKYKGVNFYINHSDDIDTDKYDLIITDKVVSGKNISRKLLVEEDILLAVAKTNPIADGDFVVEDLSGQKFITMNENRGIYKLTRHICDMAGFEPDIVIQSDDPYYIRKYIEMGLGISFVPAVSWGGLFTDEVVCRKITDEKRYTYLYTNTQKYMSNAVREFMMELMDTAHKFMKR